MKNKLYEKAKQAVLEYIEDHDGTSYVEIEKVFESIKFDWCGEKAMPLRGFDNIILWEGWNSQAFNVIRDLYNEGKIEQQSTTPLVYVFDGKWSADPIAKGAYQYKEPHWLPTVFNAKDDK